MKQFIVTWTLTVNAADADQAMQKANDTMEDGGITPDVEEVEEGSEVAL